MSGFTAKLHCCVVPEPKEHHLVNILLAVGDGRQCVLAAFFQCSAKEGHRRIFILLLPCLASCRRCNTCEQRRDPAPDGLLVMVMMVVPEGVPSKASKLADYSPPTVTRRTWVLRNMVLCKIQKGQERRHMVGLCGGGGGGAHVGSGGILFHCTVDVCFEWGTVMCTT